MRNEQRNRTRHYLMSWSQLTLSSIFTISAIKIVLEWWNYMSLQKLMSFLKIWIKLEHLFVSVFFDFRYTCAYEYIFSNVWIRDRIFRGKLFLSSSVESTLRDILLYVVHLLIDLLLSSWSFLSAFASALDIENMRQDREQSSTNYFLAQRNLTFERTRYYFFFQFSVILAISDFVHNSIE